MVQIAARWNYVDVIEKVLNSFEGASNEAECMHYLMLHQNKEGKNALLCAADYNMFSAVDYLIRLSQSRKVYSFLTPSQQVGAQSIIIANSSVFHKILMAQEIIGRSLLHIVSQFPSSTTILSHVLDAVKHADDREQMLKLLDSEGNTPMHRYARNVREDGVKCLLKHMTDLKSLSHILNAKNADGKRPIDLAVSESVYNLLNWANVVSDEYYPLLTPPAFIIFYSSINRQGSNSEKNCIENAMKDCMQIAPTIKENPTQQEIVSTIRNTIMSAEGREASGMIVVVMSHGEAGSVEAADGKMLIHEVIHRCVILSFMVNQGLCYYELTT